MAILSIANQPIQSNEYHLINQIGDASGNRTQNLLLLLFRLFNAGTAASVSKTRPCRQIEFVAIEASGLNLVGNHRRTYLTRGVHG